MQSGKKVIRNSLLMFGQNVIVYGLTLILAGVTARKLGSENFGIYSYSVAFADIFCAIALFGLRSVTVREVAQARDATKRYVELAFTLRLLLSGIAWIVLVVLAWVMHRESVIFVCLLIASTTVILNTVSTTMRDIFQGLEQMEIEASTQIGIRVFTFVGVIVAFQLGQGLLTIVTIYAAGFLVGVLIPYLGCRRAGIQIGFRLSIPEAKSELRRGLPFAANTGLGILMTKITPVAVGRLGSQSMLGVFTVGRTLLYPLYVIPDSIATAIYPTIARDWQNPAAKIETVLQRTYFYLTLLGLPIAVGGFICGGPLIAGLFGPKYPEAALIFRILVAFMPFEFLSLPATYALGAIHQQKQVVITSIVSAILNLVLIAILIPLYGAMGAAIAGILVCLVYFAMTHYFISKYFKVFGDFSRYSRLGVATLLMGLAIYPLRNANAALSIATGVAVYSALILLFRILSLRQARDFLRQAAGRQRS